MMQRHGKVHLRLHVCSMGVMLALATLSASAQQQPQRLSEWLTRNDPAATGYLTGLSWRVPDEVPAQLGLKLELLQALADNAVMGAGNGRTGNLAALIDRLPVTGRVPITMTDARWLETNPDRDPLLLTGHAVDLPARPQTVTVVSGSGDLCRVLHVAGQEAGSYIRTCADTSDGAADWAWVAQPDGRVERYGVAAWNRQPQDLPAPGAWIWAPPRNERWPEWFSAKLITFLSFQGPAPDRGVAVSEKPSEHASVSGPGGISTGVRWSGVVQGLVAPQRPASEQPERQMQIPQAMLLRDRSQGLPVSSSDWGSVGLIQTPSARMRDPGSVSFHVGRVEPYTRMNVFFQPFKWMEAGFRYTSITNRPYGPANTAQDQSYKDKGVDVKFSLRDESAYVPAVALGFRDIAGTGFFSGEFLVASKRVGAFDTSLGVGWGNPAGAPQRFVAGTPVGNFKFSNFFSGTPRPFGGIQWHTPHTPLVLKAEYDGNDYQAEPLANRFVQKSKLNFGLTYKIYPWLDFTAGHERGNTLSIGLTLHTDLSKLTTPKLNDAPRIAVVAARPQKAPDWATTATDLKTQTDWRIGEIRADGNRLAVIVEDPEAAYWRDRVDRAAGVLHRDAPAGVDRFVLRYRTNGMDLSEQMIDRQGWVESKVQPLPPSRQVDPVVVQAAAPASSGELQYSAKPETLETNFRIGYAQSFGGPDSFLLYQFYAEQSARLLLGRPDTWLSGAVRLRLLDNYDKFSYTAPSNLPRVRTFLREYTVGSTFTMPNLQATHVRQVTDNNYVSVYGGYLEEMFAGVGGEWLYRPFASRFALGIDANAVQQRGFNQDFSFRNPRYRVTTGHVTGYWNTGWNGVELRGSVGRYLAGDIGVTAEASRQFRNGLVIGAFATKTDVSAQQFGEGSFDKGIFLSIPFDAMFTRSSGRIANFDWKPLTRDGGAKLWRSERLYDITKTRDLRNFAYQAASPPDNELRPADLQPQWKPEPVAPAVYTAAEPRQTLRLWQTDGDATFRLVQALNRQGFRNVAIEFDQSYRLNLKVAHDAMRPHSRAVGRAARTALAFMPAETRELRIQFAERVEPIVEYDFLDLKSLARHFAGEIPAAALQEVIAVRYINPGARESDPLAALADASTAPQIPGVNDVLSITAVPSRVMGDFSNAAAEVRKVDWLGFAGVGIAAVAGSSLLDSRGLSFAKTHAKSSWLKGLNRVGDAVPWMGFVGAGILALDGSDPRRSRTGYAAVEAGATAVVAATGLKYVIGRPRPNSKESKYSLHPLGGGKYDSMPSRHAALAWAVATPFALEYRAPWLYGIAGLSNIARVGKQKHWFSDTVAGSVLGYGLGRLFWESSRANSSLPQVFVEPGGVGLSWNY